MIGIYKIENLMNKRAYIGQSKNILKRFANHKIIAFNEKDHSYNYPLYKAIRKYGLENFSFEIIEECLVKELNEKERFWISFYNSFFEGYNQGIGGEQSRFSLNKENIIGIVNDLEKTDMFHKDIAIKWNTSIEMVQGINTGRYWKYDRKYPIQRKKEHRCNNCGIKINKTKSNLCSDCYALTTRIVERPSKEQLKQEIRNTPFLHLGKKYGVSGNAVVKWCKSYNLPHRKYDIKKYTDEEWLLI